VKYIRKQTLNFAKDFIKLFRSINNNNTRRSGGKGTGLVEGDVRRIRGRGECGDEER
jgi:hypothetical protein